MSYQSLPSHILPLLPEEFRLAAPHGLQTERLAGDGSGRIFYRIRTKGLSCLAVLPDPNHPLGVEAALREARAAIHIGRHLADLRIPVPSIIAGDLENGVLLFEDLGNTLLHDVVRTEGWTPRTLVLYQQTVEELARMQITGARHFDPAWCWDTPRYDRALMLARESGYFASAFCNGLLGISALPDEVMAEFAKIADTAAAAPAEFFLHRDFQSRNLMVQDGRIRIIDFQGARLGPLGYDLASLLNDPYAQIPEEWKNSLFSHYVRIVQGMLPLFDREAFHRDYHALSLQRNLQVLGAFAFLSQVRGKIFFKQYLRPAKESLTILLAAPYGEAFPALREFTAKIKTI